MEDGEDVVTLLFQHRMVRQCENVGVVVGKGDDRLDAEGQQYNKLCFHVQQVVYQELFGHRVSDLQIPRHCYHPRASPRKSR